jgi:hypothetical protein
MRFASLMRLPALLKWTCPSMNPGTTNRPRRSMTSVSGALVGSGLTVIVQDRGDGVARDDHGTGPGLVLLHGVDLAVQEDQVSGVLGHFRGFPTGSHHENRW